MKKVFIIHGWGGFPKEAWFPWLKKELEKQGFKVKVPQMPDPETPKIKSWVAHLAKVIGQPDKNTSLVGHSIGCQTIARYLETLPEGGIFNKVVFVSGFVKLKGLEEEEKNIAKPWIKTPIKWGEVRRHAKDFVAIHSDNDPYVSLTNADFFKKNLRAKIIIEHKKGHIGGSDGFKKLFSALKALLE